MEKIIIWDNILGIFVQPPTSKSKAMSLQYVLLLVLCALDELWHTAIDLFRVRKWRTRCANKLFILESVKQHGL